MANYADRASKLFHKARHKAHRHAVIVYRGSNIISTGVNHDEIHAEVSALRRLWPSERKGTKVVSLRMTRGGRLGMAKPCPECEAYMRREGVKLVLYSNEQGQMERMKL